MLEIIICVGTDCSFKGSLDIHEFLEHDRSLQGKVLVKTGKCFEKACKSDNAPVVSVDGTLILKATLDKVLAAIQEKLK